MPKNVNLSAIRVRARRVYRELLETHSDPRNADRALFGALAVLTFADATGQSADVPLDPETVLGDLLAYLMHWSDEQKSNPCLEESISFEAALSRARLHYMEEVEEEGARSKRTKKRS